MVTYDIPQFVFPARKIKIPDCPKELAEFSAALNLPIEIGLYIPSWVGAEQWMIVSAQAHDYDCEFFPYDDEEFDGLDKEEIERTLKAFQLFSASDFDQYGYNESLEYEGSLLAPLGHEYHNVGHILGGYIDRQKELYPTCEFRLME